MFLQQEDISLVQPRIEVPNTIIDSFVSLHVKSGMEGIEIYFTSDGSEPTTTFFKYEKPLTISEPGTYKFKSFHPEWKSSETTSITFFKKGHQPKNIVWNSKQNEKYSGQGPLTLINQKKAALPYSNLEWVGFDSIVNAEVFF
jgi:hexosaminidase